MHLSSSELILNKDGSIYHLNLHPEQIADTIFTVGDPDRVEMVSHFFDKVTDRVHKREFCTHTGELNGKRLTVISTGIGTDNVDIVLNELDALVNIDLQTRTIRSERKRLKFIRLGTSGAMQKDIETDSFLVSHGAVGIDALLHFYDYEKSPEDNAFLKALEAHLGSLTARFPMYYFSSSPQLQKIFEPYEEFHSGITVTCPGFYGPQGRSLRLKLEMPELNNLFSSFEFEGRRLSNFEMESSAIFGLGSLLGHQTLAINTILANRSTGAFSKTPKASVKKMISKVLEIITNLPEF